MPLSDIIYEWAVYTSFYCFPLNDIEQRDAILQKDKNGFNALHRACYNKSYDVVKLFLEKGNLTKNDILRNLCGFGKSALTIAFEYERYDVVLLMIELFDLDEYDTILSNNNYFDTLCNKGHVDIIKTLLEKYEIDEYYILGGNLLSIAHGYNNCDIVKLLLDRFNKVTQKNYIMENYKFDDICKNYEIRKMIFDKYQITKSDILKNVLLHGSFFQRACESHSYRLIISLFEEYNITKEDILERKPDGNNINIMEQICCRNDISIIQFITKLFRITGKDLKNTKILDNLMWYDDNRTLRQYFSDLIYCSEIDDIIYDTMKYI